MSNSAGTPGLARMFWGILTPVQRRWVLAAQGMSLLMAVSTVTGVASITPFFAVLGDPAATRHYPIVAGIAARLGLHGDRSLIVVLGVGFVGVVLLTNFINLVGSYGLLRLSAWIGDELRTTLYAEYLRREFLFHLGASSSTLLNNIVRETTRVSVGILQNGFLLLTSLSTAVVILACIVFVSPLAGIAVMAGLAGGYSLVYLGVRQRILRAGRTEAEASWELTQLIVEGFGAIREITVMGRHDWFIGRFARASRAIAGLSAYIGAITQSPRYLIECIAAGGLVCTALVMSENDGGIGRSLAQLTFLGFAVYRLLPNLQQAFAAVVSIRAAHTGFTAIAGDISRARARTAGRRPSASAEHVDPRADRADWLMRPREEIRFTDVTFRYAPATAPALSGVNLRIPAGAMVGLVGRNGSGKSTLVDLLAGLLTAESGSIQIDGVRLDDNVRAAWRSRVAYVPQEIFLLDSTIAGNIALGVAIEDIDRGRLAEAARLARLDGFVSRLPAGFEERIGERGVKLSGGQRQRIGIARALYTDATVLILDEATNALDSSTEEDVMTSVEALRGQRTIIVIAHRLHTLDQCDVIFELESGKLVRRLAEVS